MTHHIAEAIMILPDTEQTRVQAAEIIQRGGLIAFRTDTYYALGGDPLNPVAVAKIKQVKGREETKPILILIADARDVVRFVSHRTAAFDGVAERHWPGPLTLVGKARPELPDELTAGTGTIGVRMPNDEPVRTLLRICGGSLTGTSANLSGQPPARSAANVDAYFPMGIDLILDGGEVTATEPSTVLDLSGPAAMLVREGAIRKAGLQKTLAEFSVPLA